jgi:hypothetical protein
MLENAAAADTSLWVKQISPVTVRIHSCQSFDFFEALALLFFNEVSSLVIHGSFFHSQNISQAHVFQSSSRPSRRIGPRIGRPLYLKIAAPVHIRIKFIHNRRTVHQDLNNF